MKTMILCGGQGMRLREETEYRPKPLVTIGGRPILWHIMKIYANAGFRDFVLCLGYRGDMIKEYFLNYEAMTNDFTITLGDSSTIEYHDRHREQDFRVTLAETGQNAQTGARVRRASRFVDDTFMVTYGDGVADIDVGELAAFHRAHGKLATMTVVQPNSRYGVVEVGDGGKVDTFAEKPQLQGWANAGFFVFSKKVVDYLKADDDCILEHEPLERLVRERQLVAYEHRGAFYSMDTYREYVALNDLWSRGVAPWKIWKDHSILPPPAAE